ncbi:uncharacterized protein BDZ99DRAFT_144051 [Mytilinidion resinicola]|uniref:Heterokaryon incompatibility domain-containing protein n=1 Tax=Mytilinidion resinicola TaxID=574789 RepID=A0A6A6Y8F9_9PEZI|nr:uncharacterized protein BDZ99DRAFT_144051 [Mytilinidion resinicola]KAF2804838.1 hypothetical protein BDZ99DRAFT_144051 [Mytilinidion resinicola]
MDLIYGYAQLTIINASGAEANSGFSRRSDDKPVQVIETLKPGLEVMLATPFEDSLEHTIYASRAWTFQERLLASRCVVLLDGRTYFHCRRGFFTEDINIDAKGRQHSQMEMYRLPIDVLNELAGYRSFARAVQEYSKRNLTDENDALNGFAGTQNVLSSKVYSSFFQGLPAAQFDLALLWQPEGRLRRRKGFPSWSWAGWEGYVSFQPLLNEMWYKKLHRWLHFHTFIVWYRFCTKTNQWKPVWNEEDHRAACKYYKAPYLYAGYVKATEGVSDPYGRSSEPLSWLPKGRTTLPSPLDGEIGVSSTALLAFWTYCTSFRVEIGPDNPDSKDDSQNQADRPPGKDFSSNGNAKPPAGLRYFDLHDCNGNVCGYLDVDCSQTVQTGAVLDVLVLCEAELSKKEDDVEDPWRVGYAAELVEKWSAVVVMAVMWQDGVAERVALGKLMRAALEKGVSGGDGEGGWRRAEKVWREVLLR